MEYLIEFNSQIASIECSVDEVSTHIESLFKDLLSSSVKNESPLVRYSVDSNDQAIVVKRHRECIYQQKDSNLVEVANVLMNEIKLDLIKHIDTHVVLHAALVSYDKTSILLPGNSGNGKSLLTLGLLSLGCGYHTDEVVLIDLETEQLTPFVRPLMVKPHGIAAVKSLLGIKMDDVIIQGATMSALPIDELHEHFGLILNRSQQLHSLHKPPPIEVIVFPYYDNESQGEVVCLTPAQTLIELFKSNVTGRNLPKLGMSSLTQLAQKSKGIQLKYSNYEQLPCLFDEIKASI